jgi:peptidyl-Lys metalloendopeptidase
VYSSLGAERVDGVSNFKVKTTVKNTGDETLQLLTDPRGPLTKTPSDAFIIKNVNGSSPQFTGVHIKYVHQTVAAARRPNSFTTLEPGQSFSVDHDCKYNPFASDSSINVS